MNAGPLLRVRGLALTAEGGERRRTITTGTDLDLRKGETSIGLIATHRSVAARCSLRLEPRFSAR